MEIKKNPKANLERYKLLFLAVSLIISLGLLVSAFQWQSPSTVEDFSNEENIQEEEMMDVTRQDQEVEPEQPQEQQQQQALEVFDIVEDNEDIADTEFDFSDFDEDEDINLDEEEVVDDEIFVFVKNMPEYPGGIMALRRWIGSNVNYPAVARENGIQGTVYLRFEVTKTGAVGKVELQKGVDPLLDEEAIKVVKKLARFKPGVQNGRKVNVWFSLPVTFKLN
ncbi:MAG: energy transducer TonB [Bacteroidales bacterium]|nr:energy transducer TonB [Bacteroidales bacterium]